jgi:hypothetical protein
MSLDYVREVYRKLQNSSILQFSEQLVNLFMLKVCHCHHVSGASHHVSLLLDTGDSMVKGSNPGVTDQRGQFFTRERLPANASAIQVGLF